MGNRVSVNELGKRLAGELSLVRGPRAYNQTQDNCLQIAHRVAAELGYACLDRREIGDHIFDLDRFWNLSPVIRARSRANLVVRARNTLTEIHVTFEIDGKEYNYGPGTREGYDVDMKIPLRRRE